MPAINLQESLNRARDAFVEAFIDKVPSYTGASRAQVNNIAVTQVDFTLNFDVPHFLINEKMDATQVGVNLRQPGPYNAIPAARAAAEEVLEAERDRLLAQILGGLAWQSK